MYWDVKASRKARQPYPSKANFVQKKQKKKKSVLDREAVITLWFITNQIDSLHVLLFIYIFTIKEPSYLCYTDRAHNRTEKQPLYIGGSVEFVPKQ